MATHDEHLDAYLDGLLTPTERAAFEQELAQNAAMRAALDRQHRIDEALRALYAAPAAAAVLSGVTRQARAGAGHRPVAVTPGARRWLAVAASVGIIIVSGWVSWPYLQPTQKHDPYAHTRPRTVTQYYHEAVAAGMKPDWLCKTEEEFRTAFERRLQSDLTLATLPEGIKVVGLAYRNVITPKTVCVLGEVHGHPVIVFVDRAAADTAPQPERECGLRMFRRDLGDLVLYEMTPLEQPFLLEHFRQPPQG